MTNPREELLISAASRYLAGPPNDAECRDTLCVCALNYKLGELAERLDNLSPLERITVIERLNLSDRLLYHALQLTFDARLQVFYGCPSDGKGAL